MIAALADVSPLWKVVGTLLFNVGLTVFTRVAGDVLFNGVLNFDVFNFFVERWKRVGPARGASASKQWEQPPATSARIAFTDHSFGGITLTIPESIP